MRRRAERDAALLLTLTCSMLAPARGVTSVNCQIFDETVRDHRKKLQLVSACQPLKKSLRFRQMVCDHEKAARGEIRTCSG